jgi:hypothetical protein
MKVIGTSRVGAAGGYLSVLSQAAILLDAGVAVWGPSPVVNTW